MSTISSFGKNLSVLKSDSYKSSDVIKFMKTGIQDLNEKVLKVAKWECY